MCPECLRWRFRFIKTRLAAGLRPNPLGELAALPQRGREQQNPAKCDYTSLPIVGLAPFHRRPILIDTNQHGTGGVLQRPGEPTYIIHFFSNPEHTVWSCLSHGVDVRGYLLTEYREH